MVAEHDAEGTL